MATHASTKLSNLAVAAEDSSSLMCSSDDIISDPDGILYRDAYGVLFFKPKYEGVYLFTLRIEDTWSGWAYINDSLRFKISYPGCTSLYSTPISTYSHKIVHTFELLKYVPYSEILWTSYMNIYSEGFGSTFYITGSNALLRINQVS